MKFSLQLLGGASLTGTDGPVRGRAAHKRRLALLAVLASARGRAVPRERLLGLLWPDSPSQAGRHLISESLSVLRRELGEDVFICTGDDLRLNRDLVECDADAFESALEAEDPEAASRLYAGPFLDGFYVGDAPDFERWADEERERLGRLYARMLETLAEKRGAEGRLRDAAECWRQLAVHDRFSSRVALQLVQALDAAGEREAALRYAGVHAAFLREELGTEPGPELQAYVQRLRLAPPSPVVPAQSSAQAKIAPSPAEPRALGSDAAATPPWEALAASQAPVPAAPLLAPAAAPARPVQVDTSAEAEAPELAAIPALEVRLEGRSAGDGRLAKVLPPAPSVRSARRIWTAGAVGAALMVGAAALFNVVMSPGTAVSEPRLDPSRIAVLYLTPLTPDPELRALAKGFTDQLIDELGQVEALDVVPPSGVRPYRDRPVPLDSVALTLKAGTLLAGSLERSGERLRMTLYLIDAASGQRLRTTVLEAYSVDPFALEDQLGAEAARFLRWRLGRPLKVETHSAACAGLSSAVNSTCTVNVWARQRVILADQAREDARSNLATTDPLKHVLARQQLASADSLLRQAQEADSEWTEPVLERGWVALEQSLYTTRNAMPRLVRQALAHAEQAERMGLDDADVAELLGNVRFNLARLAIRAARPDSGEALLQSARRDLETAVRKEPRRARAWALLSVVFHVLGEHEKAYFAADRAYKVDAYLKTPENVRSDLFQRALLFGRFDLAAEQCAAGGREFPDDWHFRECRLVLMAWSDSTRAEPPVAEAALREIRKAYRLSAVRPEEMDYYPTHWQMLYAEVLARAGQRDSARAILRRVRGASPTDRVSMAYDEAYLRLLLGDRSGARSALSRVDALMPIMRRWTANDYRFRSLREAPNPLRTDRGGHRDASGYDTG